MHHRLAQALALRAFSRQLCRGDAGQALLAYRSLRDLGRSRPRLQRSLRQAQRLRLPLPSQQGKLALWRALALPEQHQGDPSLLAVLQGTEAWRRAELWQQQRQEQRLNARWNHRGRLEDADQLLQGLERRQPQRLVFWHHYDRRGALPGSWLLALQAMQRAGWTVVVSSSGLNADAEAALQQGDALISRRRNLGLCLGAYRDFCCLLQERPQLLRGLSHCLLANDSTLPVGGGKRLAACLEAMATDNPNDQPRLLGMTDSIERDAYHLQSYWLLANGCLLRSKAWRSFWPQLALDGHKDDLINQGEIGLSQALLKAGVALRARHGLIAMLVAGEELDQQLERFEVREPRGVNLSLYAWQALLHAGCPLLKKQVLFNLRPYPRVPIPLTELGPFLNDADVALRNDLETLLQSRYLGP
ncbi:hypothetical protein [Synechococcus sp. HK01-R]|uniref:hypothetical protein n=1 Tax=Synechococcus sp. HK01-R TaxID=2751171 RepID=UPI0016260619|nr:hypothetical protein [Synechococcus sp. HK01-R]QNG27785.1 hypothetical protein H0O21_04155 [Synechococcus sp. HK01-R]